MKKYLSLFAMLLVFGCSNTYTGKITSFNNNIAPTNKIYYLEPTSEQRNDIAFDVYANYIENALTKHDYVRTNTKSKANYIAKVSYGIKDPISKVDGDEDNIDSETFYTSYFKIGFVDRRTKKPIYNTETKITTRENSFLSTSRCVIDLTFISFPNKNKSIKSEKINVSDCFVETEDKNNKKFFFF